MSYNIDTWKTKRIENLKISVEELRKVPDDLARMWGKCLSCLLMPDNITWLIDIREGTDVRGPVIDGVMQIKEINAHGEGSGTAYHEILLPALKKSTGILEAVVIWEGGDSIVRLLVKDGEITETEIEL